MKIKSLPLGIAVLVIFFGGILLTSALNLWVTASEKVPVTFSEGEFEGQYNPVDIRGSYSFEDISTSFEVPIKDLRDAFVLPKGTDAAAFECRELEEMYAEYADAGTEIGTGSVRLFVALYTGLPYEIDEETYLPQQAIAILEAQGNLTPEQSEYIQTHSVDLPDAAAPSEALEQPETEAATNAEAEVEPAEEHVEDPEARIIKGNTTFAEVLDWGLPKESIEAALGGEMPNRLLNIKDYCLEQGLEYGSIKAQLQAEVDQLPE